MLYQSLKNYLKTFMPWFLTPIKAEPSNIILQFSTLAGKRSLIQKCLQRGFNGDP